MGVTFLVHKHHSIMLLLCTTKFKITLLIEGQLTHNKITLRDSKFDAKLTAH